MKHPVIGIEFVQGHDSWCPYNFFRGGKGKTNGDGTD